MVEGEDFGELEGEEGRMKAEKKENEEEGRLNKKGEKQARKGENGRPKLRGRKER